MTKVIVSRYQRVCRNQSHLLSRRNVDTILRTGRMPAGAPIVLWEGATTLLMFRRAVARIALSFFGFCTIASYGMHLTRTVTLLVGKLYPYRRTLACVIDLKGTNDTYAICRLSEFIRGSGLNSFEYKTDQESSVRAAAG